MKIGIDLDDVVVDYMNGFCDFYNNKYCANFCVDDFTSQNIWEIIGGTRMNAVSLVRGFYKTQLFDNLKLIGGAREGIIKLAENHDLNIITARFKYFRKKTERFLEDNFNGINLKIFFPGFFNAARRKADICEKEGIELIIEDSKNYALKCAEKVTKVLLFDRPWNQENSLPENVIRVYDWNQILKEVKELKNEKQSGIYTRNTKIF